MNSRVFIRTSNPVQVNSLGEISEPTDEIFIVDKEGKEHRVGTLTNFALRDKLVDAINRALNDDISINDHSRYRRKTRDAIKPRS